MASAPHGLLRTLLWVTLMSLATGTGVVAQSAQQPGVPQGTPPATAAPPQPNTQPQRSTPQSSAPANAPAEPSAQAPSEQNPSNAAPATSPDATGQPTPMEQQGQEPISAEPSGNDQSGMFVFKKQVEEVVLHATVTDEQRRLVPSLDKAAFTVYEDGVPQTITSFRREDVPVAMGVVIDNSGSMRDKRAAVNRAVMNLVRASNPQDEVFVVNFNRNYYLDQDFTSDANLLQASLRQVSTSGTTALYDAIAASAVHLKNNPRLDKQILLVITDGQDNMSQLTLQEAARRLQQANGPVLFAIGLSGGGLQMSGRQALQNLADGSGGVAYFPESLEEVSNITRTIAHDVRSQYYIAYKPRKQQGARPSYQSIRVDARAPGYGRLTVRTRTGIYQNEGR